MTRKLQFQLTANQHSRFVTSSRDFSYRTNKETFETLLRKTAERAQFIITRSEEEQIRRFFRSGEMQTR
jgi:hypothetical protein